LTQHVIRPDKFRKLISHDVDRATFTTLTGNEVSNRNRTDVNIHKSDADFPFVVVGRVDCFSTTVNRQPWSNRRSVPGHEICKRSTMARRPTFAHLVNEFLLNYQLMIDRHNQVVKGVKEAVLKRLAANFTS
jgi:hypothetical protein